MVTESSGCLPGNGFLTLVCVLVERKYVYPFIVILGFVGDPGTTLGSSSYAGAVFSLQ